MLVSVIIPNYCHAKYLDQRIQSVLNQTYQNFEVIILDDCSPDDGASKAIIEKYRGNNYITHIVYNSQNSRSTFKQWQKGLKLAKGEIIWIAESDDYCTPDFLSCLIDCWKKYPDCSIIQSATCRVNSNGEKISPDQKFSGKIEYKKGREFICHKMLCSNFHIPNASAVTFKKDIAMSIPSDYMQYKAAGDRLFWIYLLEKGGICKIDLPLNYFRQHEVKVTQSKELDGTQGRENYRINKYLHERGYISGRLCAEEFVFYYNYFHQHPYTSEAIRHDLLKTWFPWWKRNSIYHRLMKLYLKLTAG